MSDGKSGPFEPIPELARPLLRVPLDHLEPGVCDLADDAARYVTRVHRLGQGAVFLAFDPRSAEEAHATLIEVGKRVRIDVGALRRSSALPRHGITVVQTASKGSKVEDVLRDATELGATRFIVAIGRRSVKLPEARALGRWERVALEAARQCGRGDVPTIGGPLPLEEALEESGDVRWLLDPGGNALPKAELAENGTAVLVIGPEGGFAPEEVALAEGLGFARVKLGRFVLRTETACAAAIGALLAQTRG